MIDSTHLKVHRTAQACSIRRFSMSYRTNKRRTESKLHIICDGHGRPVLLLLTEGQLSKKG